jgi:hypothetical protein
MLASFFFGADPKKVSSGSSFTPMTRSGPLTQYVAVLSAAKDAICCVTVLPRGLSPSGVKDRFASFLTVLHFRKYGNTQKIGSSGKNHSVI